MRLADLPKDEQRTLRWGSHVPVLEALIDTFLIGSVLELGAGYNSTPLFALHVTYVVSIEADAAWIEELHHHPGFHRRPGLRLIHQPVPRKVDRRTPREKLPAGELARASAFYRSCMPAIVDLLFVDCYAGYRRQAILDLYPRARAVVFHDCEPAHDHQYGYSSMTFAPGWIRLTDRTWPAHTGILLSPSFAHAAERFRAAHVLTTARFAQRFGVEHAVDLA